MTITPAYLHVTTSFETYFLIWSIRIPIIEVFPRSSYRSIGLTFCLQSFCPSHLQYKGLWDLFNTMTEEDDLLMTTGSLFGATTALRARRRAAEEILFFNFN